jgi:hypothetical protein
MIGIDAEAALEILDARDFYEARRTGLGPVFQDAADAMLDAIEATPARFPEHPFAKTVGTRRALFPRPWPYAFAFIVLETGPFVLACEHLRRAPLYWAHRLRRPPGSGSST